MAPADDSGNATSIQTFDDPLRLLNLTVWESVDALRAFAYRGLTATTSAAGRSGSSRTASATALWWIPAGSLPTVPRQRAASTSSTASATAVHVPDRQPPTAARHRPHRARRPMARRLIAGWMPSSCDLPGARGQPLLADARRGRRRAAVVSTSPTSTARSSGAVRTARSSRYVARSSGCSSTPSPRRQGRRRDPRHARGGGTRRGATGVVLETGRRQPAALGLYARLGFDPGPGVGRVRRLADVRVPRQALRLPPRVTSAPRSDRAAATGGAVRVTGSCWRCSWSATVTCPRAATRSSPSAVAGPC